MTDSEYKAFLRQVEAALPKWDATLKGMDLEKVPQLSYAQGKSIADQRDLALIEIGNVRNYAAKELNSHTVYGELALRGFLESLFDVGQEIVWEEDFSGLNLTNLDKLAPDLSSLISRVANDVMARVALLEKRGCPDNNPVKQSD